MTKNRLVGICSLVDQNLDNDISLRYRMHDFGQAVNQTRRDDIQEDDLATIFLSTEWATRPSTDLKKNQPCAFGRGG